MIDLQTFRIRIGMFCLKSTTKAKQTQCKFQLDASAMGIALICTLLVIGGVELNPGPPTKEECHSSGPSFMDASLMDVMQAIRVTQMQIDKLSLQMQNLTSLVNGLVQTQQTNQHVQEYDDILPNDSQTRNGDQPVSHRHEDRTHSEKLQVDGHIEVTAKKKTRKNGAILIGSDNVRRIKAAAMAEFEFDSNVHFVTSGSDYVMQRLSEIMAKSKAQKIDVVLHTGADQLKKRTADSVLRASSNMLTRGANASPVERIASPVASICLPSQNVNFSQNDHLCNTFLLGASHGLNNKY